ncbi:hypothetical protein GGR50DRAFT_698482 [Xylaria sp. CBS 124048]|nr:hypothetical protein GGR50DRAFT_698482 [Xylaria sp. CBS 124048]
MGLASLPLPVHSSYHHMVLLSGLDVSKPSPQHIYLLGSPPGELSSSSSSTHTSHSLSLIEQFFSPSLVSSPPALAMTSQKTVPMVHVFCAYCGRKFSRKEHLERHLPNHCHLGFSRRDLLQRHHVTYHVERDPVSGHSGAVNPAGRTHQIACASCATAKTGCDKQHPSCSRCRDKNLPCEIRYARRTARVGGGANRRPRRATLSPGSLTQQLPLPDYLVQPTSQAQMISAPQYAVTDGGSSARPNYNPRADVMTITEQLFSPQMLQNPLGLSMDNFQTNPPRVLDPNQILHESPNSMFQYFNGCMPQDAVYPPEWSDLLGGIEMDPEHTTAMIIQGNPYMTMDPLAGNTSNANLPILDLSNPDLLNPAPSVSSEMTSYFDSSPSMHSRTNSRGSQSRLNIGSPAIPSGLNIGSPAIPSGLNIESNYPNNNDLAGISPQFGWSQHQESPSFSSTNQRADETFPGASVDQDDNSWDALQRFLQKDSWQ